jgi:Mg-chelatase subunit ChlD
MQSNAAWDSNTIGNAPKNDKNPSQNHATDDQCAAPKQDGTRCERTKHNGTDTCWQHEDENAKQWPDSQQFNDNDSDTNSTQQSTQTKTVPVYDAVELGLLDKGLFDVGPYDALLDPNNATYQFATDHDRQLFVNNIDPLIHEAIEETQNESDPQTANKLILEYIDKIIEYLEAADEPGMDNAGNRDGTSPVRPDDSGTQTGPAAVIEPVEIPNEISEQQDDSNDSQDKDSEIEAEIETEINRETRQAPPQDNTTPDDADPLQEAIDNDSDDAGLTQQTVDDVPPKSNPEHADLVEPAKQKAKLIRQELSLNKKQATEIERNKRHGKINSTHIVRAHVGDTRRYKETIGEPDSPEFNLILILDRSISMHEEERKTAISAVLQSVYALDYYKEVDVGVYELYNNTVRRSMPLGDSPAEHTSQITHGGKAGKTPLTEALALSRTRLKTESDPNTKNRIFIITDGEPSDETAYQNELSQTSIPVVGLSINDNPNRTAAGTHYHKHTIITNDGAGLTANLKQLLSELTND